MPERSKALLLRRLPLAAWIGARLTDPLAPAILALGLTQIIGWGTTVYALGVLGGPIVAETGWRLGVVYGGLTVALLASGAASVPVGRGLDRRGGRAVMATGSIVAACGLAALSQARTLTSYFAAWAISGVAMRMMLYDASFAALVQLSPSRGRRAISFLTLFGGLASSVMWPVGAAIEQTYGWRTTLLVYAVLNLAVCLPLHWFALRRPGVAHSIEPATTVGAIDEYPPLAGAARRNGMAMFAATMAAGTLVGGAIAPQMVPILGTTGLASGTAVALASGLGITQTLARLIDLVFGRRMHALTLGRITIALMLLAMLILAIGRSGTTVAVIFVVLFGAANGLATIVRGAVPLALFGAAGYGEVMGRLSAPILVMNAFALPLYAVMADAAGANAAICGLAVLAGVSCVAMEVLAAWYYRTQK